MTDKPMRNDEVKEDDSKIDENVQLNNESKKKKRFFCC